MVFLRTSSGRIGYLKGNYDPWGPGQLFWLTDVTSGEAFYAYSKDLSAIPPAQQQELKSRFELAQREKEKADLAKRLDKHTAFVKSAGDKEPMHEPMSALPPHGYLVCNSCGSDLSIDLKIQCAKCKWPICNCGACRCGNSIKLHPEYVEGAWKKGITLDVQTLESHAVGEDELGRPVFNTRRSELGELLYLFKYQSDQRALEQILAIVTDHLSKTKGRFDLIVPIPPSNPTRTVTQQIAAGLAAGLGAPTSTTAVTKVRATDELKSITDPTRRKELLKGAFAADPTQILGKSILLVDDLYRSGATLEAATEAAYARGGAKAVYVFAVTRTRVHR